MNFVVNGTILLVLILKLKRKYLVCGSVNVVIRIIRKWHAYFSLM